MWSIWGIDRWIPLVMTVQVITGGTDPSSRVPPRPARAGTWTRVSHIWYEQRAPGQPMWPSGLNHTLTFAQTGSNRTMIEHSTTVLRARAEKKKMTRSRIRSDGDCTLDSLCSSPNTLREPAARPIRHQTEPRWLRRTDWLGWEGEGGSPCYIIGLRVWSRDSRDQVSVTVILSPTPVTGRVWNPNLALHPNRVPGIEKSGSAPPTNHQE